VIAPSPKAQHSEVNITGLSDMTLNTEVGVAHTRTFTAESRKRFKGLLNGHLDSPYIVKISDFKLRFILKEIGIF
jgi:hypothetical protein